MVIMCPFVFFKFHRRIKLLFPHFLNLNWVPMMSWPWNAFILCATLTLVFICVTVLPLLLFSHISMLSVTNQEAFKWMVALLYYQITFYEWQLNHFFTIIFQRRIYSPPVMITTSDPPVPAKWQKPLRSTSVRSSYSRYALLWNRLIPQ